MFKKVIYIEEPKLMFGDGNCSHDPRDGLILYGPYEKWGKEFRFNNHTISAGVAGTQDALIKYKEFVQLIKRPIISKKRNKRGKLVSNEIQRPSFPGFEAVFNIHWPEEPDIFAEISSLDIENIFKQTQNRRKRTTKLVDIYLSKILKETQGADLNVNIWFVLVPKNIYDNCRIKKGFGKDFSKNTVAFIKDENQLKLFPLKEIYGEENVEEYLENSSDFHHLLKAKANLERINAPIQIMVEPKLEFRDIETRKPYSDDMKAHLAWSLCSALYYKLGKKPWKLASIRPGVCYLGLVFKKLAQKEKDQNACSAAQLFMDDGDGTVFRGNNGLWLTDHSNEFHLNKEESFNLLNLALTDYFDRNNNTYPKELFIHGRAAFSESEWSGFLQAVENHGANTKLVGVVIKDKASLKFFRDVDGQKSNFGVLRGIAGVVNEKEAYLFTRGFIPRLNTSSSLELPNPLHVKVTMGEANIKTVLADILALTKLNYNSCIYGDGKPVTLRFSDSIGSILTATENWKEEKRQFKYYI